MERLKLQLSGPLVVNGLSMPNLTTLPVFFWNIDFMEKVDLRSEFLNLFDVYFRIDFIIRVCHLCRDVSTENLKYLSSEQALADIAYFITEMKKDFETGPWIVFGGSYAGSLAAWARLKYPHLVAGAVSSSGPLLAKIDFNGLCSLKFL